MSLNSYLDALLGSTVAGVVVQEAFGNPRQRLHLVLDDGNYFEFFGNDFHNAKGPCPGRREAALREEGSYYRTVLEMWEGE